MKHQFAPTLLCALTLAACGSQSGVIGERQPGIDNQSVGDGKPDAGDAPQSNPPPSLELDAGSEPEIADPNAPSPGQTSSTPGPSTTASSTGAEQTDAPDAAVPADATPQPSTEPCSDETPIELPAQDVAERLAQLMISRAPDDELLTAAAEGHLGTYGEVECQARRLAGLPESNASVTALLQSWLQFDAWPTDASEGVSEELWAQMNTEATDYLERVASAEQSSLSTLLQDNSGLLKAELAAHYGVTLPDGESQALLEIPHRVGVLTLGQVTASLHRIGQRGSWISKRFECVDVGPPTPPQPAPPSEGITYRQQYEASIDAATCASCHSLIDGPGFTLENFTSDGRYVTEEQGQPVDNSGYFSEVDNGMPSQIQIEGAAELAAHMVQSPTVLSCLSRRAIDFALNASPYLPELPSTDADAQRVTAQFAARDGDLRELLIAITQTSIFWDAEP